MDPSEIDALFARSLEGDEDDEGAVGSCKRVALTGQLRAF